MPFFPGPGAGGGAREVEGGEEGKGVPETVTEYQHRRSPVHHGSKQAQAVSRHKQAQAPKHCLRKLSS